MELIQVVNSTLPSLQDLMKHEQYQVAVQIVQNSMQLFKEKLMKVRCLKGFDKNFTDARQNLESRLSSEFIETTIAYVSSLFSYNTNPLNISQMNDMSILEESFIINQLSSPTDDAYPTTQPLIDDIDQKAKLLPWTLNQGL